MSLDGSTGKFPSAGMSKFYATISGDVSYCMCIRMLVEL